MQRRLNQLDVGRPNLPPNVGGHGVERLCSRLEGDGIGLGEGEVPAEVGSAKTGGKASRLAQGSETGTAFGLI